MNIPVRDRVADLEAELAEFEAELAQMRSQVTAANSIVAEREIRIATARSALIAGEVDRAIEILGGQS